jgi:tetratricopeptide (TPR) repeat protein
MKRKPLAYLLSCLLATWLLTPSAIRAQNAAESDFSYTKHLSHQFPDSAFLLLKEMYSRALEKKDQLTTANCLQQMGQVSYYLGNYPKALDFHSQADKLFRELHRDELLAGNLNDMGLVYYYNKQSAQARRQYDEALSIYRAMGKKEGLADTYGKIGHLYEKQKLYDSAFYFQRLALQEYTRIAHPQGMGKIFENIGSIYEDMEQFDSARYYFTRSLQSYQQAHEEVASIEVLNNLGDVYRKTGDYTKAMEQTRLSLLLAEKTNDLYEKGAAYRDLGKTWNLLHNNDSAYYYLELSRRVTIDIYSAENNRQTAFLSTLYEIDKKNNEITRLESERRVTIIVTTSVILLVLLVGILAWVVFSRQRLKIRNASTLQEHQERIHEAQHELMQVELTNKQLQEEKLVGELDLKKRKLTAYTLHLVQKNQLLEDLCSRLKGLVQEDKRDNKKQLQQLVNQITANITHDEYWNGFREAFEQVHEEFFQNLKKHATDLTGNDLRLMTLIKLNIGSKDIATILGISPDSLRVSRYRLKKKLNLEEGSSLTNFVQTL